jgi:hypothetical protein
MNPLTPKICPCRICGKECYDWQELQDHCMMCHGPFVDALQDFINDDMELKEVACQ